ncbi:MAG: PAS domain S-box protein [Chloroflexaceae bacterium]
MQTISLPERQYTKSRAPSQNALTLPMLNQKAELEQRVVERTSALRQSQTLLAQFLDNIPAACYTLDMQECYLMINQVGAQVIGYTPEAIVGKSADKLLPAEVTQSWHTQIIPRSKRRWSADTPLPANSM